MRVTRRRVAATTLAVALLGTGLAVTPRPAPPRPAAVVPCGAVLTTSVRLAADVSCPGGGGITLAADGIELDLDGHAVLGPGRGNPSIGVRIAARDVVVRGGRIAGWSSGVAAGTGGRDSEAPATLSGTVRDARVEGNDFGVDVAAGGAITVRRTRLIGNGHGGAASFGGRLRVVDSAAEGNDTGLSSVAVPVDGLVVHRSLLRHNASAGISCSQDGHYDVTGSTLQSNGVGLELFECGGRLTGSTFAGNGRHVSGYLSQRDQIVLRCNTYTRAGGPVGFPVLPCGES